MGKAEMKAARLLKETGQSDQTPVDVEAIARHLHAQVVEERLDRSVSGLLYRDGEQIVIGVNSTHSNRGRRFTIAHEIGHLVPHKGRPLVLDHVRVNFRDANSSMASDLEEIQANAFAAEILMPQDQVIASARRLSEDQAVTESATISYLAQGFDVSEEAMQYRLIDEPGPAPTGVTPVVAVMR